MWLTQEEIARLFEVQSPAITKHIKNIFATKELQEDSVCSILELTARDGKKYKTKLYNLDLILSVGYRVNSKSATQFRIWATNVLKQYLTQGYAGGATQVYRWEIKAPCVKLKLPVATGNLIHKEVIVMSNDINNLLHTTWNCKYHIVFAPKYRRRIFYCGIVSSAYSFSSIRSILKITGRVPSEQQAIIVFSSFIQPFMIDPPCNPV